MFCIPTFDNHWYRVKREKSVEEHGKEDRRKRKGFGEKTFQGEKLTNKSNSMHLGGVKAHGMAADSLDAQYTNFNIELFRIRT